MRSMLADAIRQGALCMDVLNRREKGKIFLCSPLYTHIEISYMYIVLSARGKMVWLVSSQILFPWQTLQRTGYPLLHLLAVCLMT